MDFDRLALGKYYQTIPRLLGIVFSLNNIEKGFCGLPDSYYHAACLTLGATPLKVSSKHNLEPSLISKLEFFSPASTTKH